MRRELRIQLIGARRHERLSILRRDVGRAIREQTGSARSDPRLRAIP